MAVKILPTAAEINSWVYERCLIERTRLRNELAFLQGDGAHGGPKREDVRKALWTVIEAIDARIKEVRG